MKELEIEPIPPGPLPEDGSVEMHPDGNGVTFYRHMTRQELAEQFPTQEGQ